MARSPQTGRIGSHRARPSTAKRHVPVRTGFWIAKMTIVCPEPPPPQQGPQPDPAAVDAPSISVLPDSLLLEAMSKLVQPDQLLPRCIESDRARPEESPSRALRLVCRYWRDLVDTMTLLPEGHAGEDWRLDFDTCYELADSEGPEEPDAGDAWAPAGVLRAQPCWLAGVLTLTACWDEPLIVYQRLQALTVYVPPLRNLETLAMDVDTCRFVEFTQGVSERLPALRRLRLNVYARADAVDNAPRHTHLDLTKLRGLTHLAIVRDDALGGNVPRGWGVMVNHMPSACLQRLELLVLSSIAADEQGLRQAFAEAPGTTTVKWFASGDECTDDMYDALVSGGLDV